VPHSQPAAAPSLLTGTNTGRTFRGLLTKRTATARGVPVGLETLQLLPISGRQVVIRVEASAPCYTMVPEVLPTPPLSPAAPFAPATGLALTITPPADLPDHALCIGNHAYVGLVEEVGPQVTRVRPGDRVVVGVTAQCGHCFQCLRGATDMCQTTFGGGAEVSTPIASLDDGSLVYPSIGIGGLSELSVAFEDYCVPVFTDVPAAELSLLADQLGSGLAVGMSRMQIDAASDVVVFGAGPVGLGAVQSARVRGAAQIIVVEPVQRRRELALELGATAVVDPVAEGDGLVDALRAMCEPATSRRASGGHTLRGTALGADYSISTVGAELYPPAVEASPDPTGVLPMQQAYATARSGGNVMWMGMVAGSVSFPASQLGLSSRTVWPGQQAGIASMRDIPRFVKLIERGVVDAASMIDGTYSLDDAVSSVRAIADRTAVATVVTPT
jgi:S-(hydroxymethyl)glutathione dehydrogenase / alcohol dehydrogenase